VVVTIIYVAFLVGLALLLYAKFTDSSENTTALVDFVVGVVFVIIGSVVGIVRYLFF